MNQITETILYYAVVPSDGEPEEGDRFYNEYIFKSEVEAVKSGHKYEVASWTIINMAADCGVFFEDVVICTPQGKFVWTESAEEDVAGDIVVTDCMYRAVGAPVAFSEAVEYHLFWTKGSELLKAVEDAGIFKAVIQNPNGEKVIIKGG